MKQFNVTGMSCAACSARVEKAVNAVEGVTSCSVSLLTNSMGVEGSASEQDIISAVIKAGYGASVKGAERKTDGDTPLTDRETPLLIARLISSLVLLAILMYVSMGHSMWGWPLPNFLHTDPLAIGITQLILSASVMVINQNFFINGFKGLARRSPNMDTLVALGSSAAFVYSVIILFKASGEQAVGNHSAAAKYIHEFYFESAAMILALITVGKMLEARSKGKTTDALKALIRLTPQTARVIRDGTELTVPVGEVKKGDLFTVRPGESVPVDGTVTEGHSAVNESALTGESIPSDKSPGDSVYAASINTSGYLKCEASRVGEDTTLSQIIKLMSDAAATKAPVAKAADKVSGIFVPAVIVIAVITVAVWLILGHSVGFALARGISVLVISCPCALGLATPVAIMVGSGKGARNGILFKTAQALEHTGRTKTVVLDKTGTITKGEPEVTDIIPTSDNDEGELLKLACSLEAKSEHPLARAIVKKADELNIVPDEAKDFEALFGNGVTASVKGSAAFGGSLSFISQKTELSEDLRQKARELSEEGKTPLLFVKEGKCQGLVAVADTIKEDSPSAVAELKSMGIRVVMLTGDNQRTADAIGRRVGVDEVIAGVLPDGKESVIRSLKSKGAVAMVGDGINDAPALSSADVGIAIGAGADIAVDAADVVLINSRLSDVPAAIRLSRATLKNIYQNLFWAFIYNAAGIPLAAGAFISLLGWELNPMFGAAAMSLSSFCVVTNALRLNLFRMHPKKNSVAADIIKNQKETDTMEKTIRIEGMMCPHCEAHVKKALEALAEVASAEVSHTAGTAVVKLSSDISDEQLKKTVEEAGYKVL